MRGKIILGIISFLSVLQLLNVERKRGFEEGLQMGRIRTLVDEGYDLDEIVEKIGEDTETSE